MYRSCLLYAVMALILPMVLAGCGSELQRQAPEPSLYQRHASGKLQGLGAILSERDELRVEARTTAAALPSQVDLRPLMPPVYHQGPMRTCTAFAIAKGLAEYWLSRRQAHVELSALHLYRMTNFEQHNQGGIPGISETFGAVENWDVGSSIAIGMERFKTIGVAPEEVHPYPAQGLWSTYATSIINPEYSRQTNGIWGSGPGRREPLANAFFGSMTPSLRLDHGLPGGARYVLPESYAKRTVFRPREVARVTTLHELRQELAQGRPVVFGVKIYESFYGIPSAQTGRIPVPSPAEGYVGGHAMLCVGYDDREQVLIVRNSWGPHWGEGGYGYLPYDFLRRGLVRDGWTAKP